MMSKRFRSRWWILVALATIAAVLALPRLTAAQDVEGFDGFIQSGTCEAPTDDVMVELESPIADYDAEPYLAKVDTEEGTITLGYYGAPLAEGFSGAAVFTDVQFSLVITRGGTEEVVACGDLLEPDAEEFVESGQLLVRLDEVGGSGVRGFAVVERTNLQREEDRIPTRVRLLLFSEAGGAPTGTPAATPVATPAG
jgi:hypothetical protein